MPDNKDKGKLSLEDKLKNIQTQIDSDKDFSSLKSKLDNIRQPGYSTANVMNDYGQSVYDESLTEQYFRQYGDGNLGYQEQRAQNQSSLAKIGSGIANTLTTGGLDILKDAGYLLDAENYFNFKKSAEEGFHNWFSDSIQSIEDKLKLPVYRTDESKGFSPLSAGWWGDNLPSIASSVAMAFPAEAAVSGLGALGNVLGGQKIIRGIETLSGIPGVADKLKGVSAAVISRQMESLMEGGQTYEDTYQTALKELKSKNDPEAEKKAKQIAGEAAANNYKANWAAIVQDLPQYMILHKTFKDANKAFSAAGLKEAAKTAALEGTEEAYQFITDKESKRSALINGKVLKDDNSTLAERLIDYSKDGDLWSSAFFGAIGGAGFGLVGTNNDYKNQQKFDDVLQAHKAILQGDPQSYNRAQDNILNSTIVDNIPKNTLEQFKQGLEYMRSNPERLKDEDRAEIVKGLNKAIEQVEYAQNLQQEVMNNTSIEPEVKKLVFNSKLNQRSIENRLLDINSKITTLSGRDAINLGFSADLQAYKAAKLKYEGIESIPILKEEAEQLKNNIDYIASKIVLDKTNNFNTHQELDKFILGSNDRELVNLYTNQAKEQANLKHVKDILYDTTSPEGKAKLKEKLSKAKEKQANIDNLSQSVKQAQTEKDLNALLKEADNKEIATPEIIDQISKKRQEIQNIKAQKDLLSELDPIESVETINISDIIDNSTVIDETNVNTVNPIEDNSKKSEYYNKTNNGEDNDSKESKSRAFRFNEKVQTLSDKRLKIVTRNNNPELYNRILSEDEEAKIFEDNYKKKEKKDYQGIYTVVTDLNNKPILIDNKLITSTLETAQRVIDGSIIPKNKEQAIANINSLRQELISSKDPNIYLQPIAKSKGIPEYLPKVGNKRQSIPVTQVFGPIEQLRLEVPTLGATSRPGTAFLSNDQIAFTGKLYTFDRNNTAFDLIPRNVSQEEADIIINLTYQRLGLIPKTVPNPTKEIEKIISTLIPKEGANEYTYGFKGNTLYVGNSNVFTVQDFQEKPQEIQNFIKSFLTSTKYVNANINKQNGYEFESKFIGPTTDIYSTKPAISYNTYKEYLLSGEFPMFGTDLSPSDSIQYRNVYLIYETDESGKAVIKTDELGDKPEITDSNGNPIVTVDIESLLEEDKPKSKRRDYYKNKNITEEELLRYNELKEQIAIFEHKDGDKEFSISGDHYYIRNGVYEINGEEVSEKDFFDNIATRTEVKIGKNSIEFKNKEYNSGFNKYLEYINLDKKINNYKEDKDNLESLDRSSKIKEAKPLQESEIKWFKSKFPNIPIDRVQGLIDNKAFGRFISSGRILLSDLAPNNTLRHEAFHVVSQLYLTQSEIDSLYKEVKNRVGDITDLQAEEILAEDFANYKDNQTILSNQPKRNSIFRKLLDFIRALIGLPAKSIEEIYNRIDKGYYTNKKLVNLRQFLTLDSTIPGLTVTQTKELYDSMDAMFSDIVFKDNKTPSQALSKTDKVLQFIYNRLVNKEKEVIESGNQQLIKAYDNILSNWSEVMTNWKERMLSLGVPIEDGKEVDFESQSEIEEQDDETKSEENNVRAGDEYKAANETSTKKTMFTSSKLLIRTLKQKNQDGTDKLNSLGLPQTVEFAPTYNYILKQTVGLSEYPDIYNKLVELSKSRPELRDLTARLKEPSDSLPLEQIIFQRQFRQDFSKNLADIYITAVQDNGNILQVNSIRQNIQERVRDRWKSNLKLLAITNPEGKLTIEPKQTKDNIEFLKSIGIEFSKESLPLTNNNKEFSDAVTAIRNYIKENKNDVTKLYNTSQDATIIGRLNYLASLEAQNNTSVMELSVLSTTNKTIYPISNNNGLSIVKNIINNAKTLQELYKALPNLNTVNAENSVWLSELFDNNGNKIKNKSIQLGLADGVTSEDISNSTADLGSTDKFIQEIDHLLKYGNSAVIRTSDKATEHIIGLGKLVIPIEDLAIDPNAKDITGFNNEKIKSIFRGYFKSELKRITNFELYDIGKNIDEYSKTGGQLTIFNSFPNISEVKEKISDTIKQLRVSVDNGMSTQEVNSIIESLYNSLIPSIDNSTFEFLRAYTAELTAKLTDYRAIEAISKDLKTEYPIDQLIRTVAVNDFINKVEQTKLFFGDMAFYKALFKRTSSLAGTKETASTDQELNSWLNKDNKRLDKKTADGKINVAIFEDATQSKQDLGEYKKSLIKSGLSESEADKLLAPYKKMDEGDAQGWITLDEFREFKIRLGQWSTQLEKVWEKAQKYDKDDTSTHLTKEELENTFFIVMKAQYAGPSIDSKLFIPTFHKFSLLPLIPQLVQGKNMSKILNNMTRQQVGYALFKSGSKVGTPLINGKANKFYTETNHGEPNIQDYNLQQVDYKFLGIQTKTSDPHDTVTFGTQFRKLIFNGAFENGEEKIPGAKQLFEEYTQIIKDQVQEAKDKLIKDLGLDPNNLQAKDVTKLVELLKSESKSRNLADNIIDSFQTITDENGNKTLKYPLDSSVNKNKIDSLIMSLVNSRLIKQKVNGDAYIQVASTGFESLGIRESGTNRALKFYEQIKDKEGNVISTSKAEVMIPMSKNYQLLLDKYGSIEEVNRAIKNKRIDEKLLTLIGYRIPTQGLNSIDHLVIKEFLPELSGSMIILPTEIVAKSGGDYDIDKMNIFRPDITKDLQLADTKHNKLISIASKMLSNPANFNALITPNSTNILTSAAEDFIYETYKAKGGTKAKDEYFKGQSKKIDYTRQLMLTENVINQHSKLMAAKGGIGPGAINNVFIPLAQAVDAKISKELKGEKVIINFPHNLDSNGNFDIAKAMDANNTNNIQEVNSQIINAFVDAANSPELLPALNMNMDTLPVYLYLNNIGVPFEYSFWLMKQPIIQEYIRELSINDSSYLSATKAKTSNSKLEERLISKYSKNITEELPPKQYTTSEDLKRLALYNPEESKDLKVNNRYYNQQVQLFEDFLRYKDEAQAMSQAIRSINYDTNGLPGSLEQTRLKLEDYKKAKQDNFIEGLDKILDSTPIGAFDQTQFAIDAYSQFYATQSKEIRDFLDFMYQEINPIKASDKAKISNLLTNDFINYVIQNYSYNNISELKDKLFKGDSSVAKRIASIQSSNNSIKDNLIIKELQPIIANEKTRDLRDNLRLYTKRYDTFTANQLTEAFRELKEQDPSLYKDIVDLGIIQSGIANSPVTYLGLIPFEYYGDLFNRAFEEFNKKNGVTQLESFKKLFIANNAKDSLIKRTYKPTLSIGDGYYGKDYNINNIISSKEIITKLTTKEKLAETNKLNIEKIKNERIQKVYPSIIEGFDTNKLKEIASLNNDEQYFIKNSDLKKYGKSALIYADKTNSYEIFTAEGIWLRDNEPLSLKFINKYLSDERSEGKTIAEYAKVLLEDNVKLIDTYQLKLQFSKRSNPIIDKLKASGFISQTHGDLFIKQHFYSQALNFINNLRKEYPNAINIERVQSKLGAKGQGIFRVKVNEQLGLQFSKGSNSNLSEDKFREIADKLKAKTGVDYEILSNKEVFNILENLGIDTSNFDEAPAFYYNNKIIIPDSYLQAETIFHEFSHPFIDVIEKDNKQLFNNIKKELENNDIGQVIIKYVKDTYTHLVNEDGELSQEGWKEAIVQALGKIADGTIKEDSNLWNELKKMLKAIAEYLYNLFNSKDNIIKPIELDENTSLLDLANMLKSDDKIDLGDLTSENTQFSLKPKEIKQLSKPEQLFQRRIDRLTKQVALEKNTAKKVKLQQELNYTTEQYIRSQQVGAKDRIYKEFGEHTLDLAEARINSLKEGNTTDLNADIEYINDVLDVWYGFEGLTDRVIQLRNAIKPLSDELLVKNINESYNSENPITIEDIRSQKKDIGTFKAWTGALLDLPNYIAHSIGYIIRASQNEIERKTNKIFSEIDDKIKEITKKSKRDIQSIYDEIIDYNKVTDSKSLIKEDKLASKSEEAKEFYKFYQSKLEELMEITPTLTRRNNEGNLETFNLNKYFIPNIYKTSLKSTLKKYSPIKERIVGDITKDQDQKADVISLDYIRKIPAKEKSDDLGNSLFLFAKSIYNYDEMSKTLPKVRLLQREIENTDYIQGSDPNITRGGKDSNLYKITEAFIKAQVKGEYKLEQGRSIVINTKTDEKGNTIESYIDITGIIDNMLRWNSLLRIGLSPVGATANILFGKISNFMEAIGGQFFTTKDIRQAERIFWKQTFDKDSVLNKELLSKYNILQVLTDYEMSENLKSGKYKKASGEKLTELMYAPQKYGEKWIQSCTLLAVMLHDGYLSPEGQLTKKFNDATQAEKEKLFGKITGINNKLHGRYSPKEAAAMQQNVIYRAITQFRKWIPAAIEARIDEKHYDPRLGVEVEGRYRTFGKKFLLELVKGDVQSAFYNLFMPLINAKEALESGKLTQSDIYNMRKMLIESVLAIGTIILYSIGTGDDEEDKKRRKQAWFKSSMLLLNRISGDLSFFYSPEQVNNLAKNAVPMSKLVDDLLKIGQEIPNAFNESKNKFKSGNSKGQYKLPKRILNVIPGSKAIVDPTKIFNKQPLDEIR